MTGYIPHNRPPPRRDTPVTTLQQERVQASYDKFAQLHPSLIAKLLDGTRLAVRTQYELLSALDARSSWFIALSSGLCAAAASVLGDAASTSPPNVALQTAAVSTGAVALIAIIVLVYTLQRVRSFGLPGASSTLVSANELAQWNGRDDVGYFDAFLLAIEEWKYKTNNELIVNHRKLTLIGFGLCACAPLAGVIAFVVVITVTGAAAPICPVGGDSASIHSNE